MSMCVVLRVLAAWRCVVKYTWQLEMQRSSLEGGASISRADGAPDACLPTYTLSAEHGMACS